MKIKVILLAVLALGLLSAAAASAAPRDLVLILDASNSMNKAFGAGTRIAAARTSLAEILGTMPEQGNVGMIVFGHRIGYQNQVESCQDIEFMYPIAPFTRAAGRQMAAARNPVTAQGKTPLADSLTLAANALAARGNGGAIVLISDGEGNCGGQELAVQQIHTFYILNGMIPVSGGFFGANLGATFFSRDTLEGAEKDEEGFRSLRKTVRKFAETLKRLEKVESEEK